MKPNEFFNQIQLEFNNYKEEELSKSKEEIFNDYYDNIFYNQLNDMVKYYTEKNMAPKIKKEYTFTKSESNFLNKMVKKLDYGKEHSDFKSISEFLTIFYANLEGIYDFSGFEYGYDSMIKFIKYYIKQQKKSGKKEYVTYI